MKVTSVESLDPQVLAAAILSGISVAPDGQAAVFTCCRRNGTRLASHRHEGSNWRQTLVRALREVDLTDATSVEIGLSHNWRSVSKFEKSFGEVLKGIRGIRLIAGSNERTLFPSEMIASNISFERFREQFAAENLGKPLRMEAFDVVQFILFPKERQLAKVFRGNQLVGPDDVTRESTVETARLMAEWMANNVDREGRLTYKYWPSKGEYSGANNTIRQFMGTICLFQSAAFYGSDFVRKKAELNLAHSITQFYRSDDGIGYIDDVGRAKLGAAALAGLAIRLDGDRFADQESKLFKLTKRLQQKDGSFLTFYKSESSKNQNFYPGECLLYWAYLLREKWSPSLHDRFRRSFGYYRAWHLDNRNPAFVPWHTQAYFILYGITKDPLLKEWIFEMNDWLLPFQQWDQVKVEDCKGRFYDPDKPYGPPHASATGVYLEGLADAFQLAVEVRDSGRADAYALVIKRALRDVMQLQFRHDVDMYYISKRERVLGGIRTTEYNNEIRVDNVQHNLMALMKILAIRDFPW